ncbi:M15 family metallopeptidase [Glutamicibacter sp. X7]
MSNDENSKHTPGEKRLTALAARGVVALLVMLAAMLPAMVLDTGNLRPTAWLSDSFSHVTKAVTKLFSGGVGEDGGDVPKGTTVHSDTAGVRKLDSELRQALSAAASDAQKRGITIYINSGWRSPALQRQLLEQAEANYGSAAEAARWVATAETSAHVSGDAVDVGQADARDWLSRYGAHYGLCQIYANESWHFEYRSEASETGCPEMYKDPTEDPRMHS